MCLTSLFEKDILYLNCYKGQKGTNQMKCPYCNNPDTRVIDSRPAEDGSCIRRRRSCDICGKRLLHMKSRDNSADSNKEGQYQRTV